MSKDMVVAGSSVTARQMKEFWKQVSSDRIKGSHFQAFLDHQNPWAIPTATSEDTEVARIEGVHADFSPVLLTLELWSRLYRDVLKFQPEQVKGLEAIWQEPLSGNWRLPVLAGLSQNSIVVAQRSLGVMVWCYAEDLDVKIPHHDRDPARDGAYLATFRARKEADVEFHELSADTLKDRGIKGITNPERLLLGLGFFLATEGAGNLNDRHLDVVNWTLCSGSRDSGGGVPRVHWDPGSRRVRVSTWFPSYQGLGLRCREAIS